MQLLDLFLCASRMALAKPFACSSGIQHVEGQPLGGLPADAGQAAKLLDQALVSGSTGVGFIGLKEAGDVEPAGDGVHLGGSVSVST